MIRELEIVKENQIKQALKLFMVDLLRKFLYISSKGLKKKFIVSCLEFSYHLKAKLESILPHGFLQFLTV